MKKIFTSLLALGLLWNSGFSQIYIDESFDTEIPATWTTSSEQDPHPWFWNDGTGYPTVNGTGYAKADADVAGSTQYLIENLDTPGFDASAGNIVIVQFDTWYNDYIGLDTGSVQVWDGTTWNTAYQIGSELGSNDNGVSVTVIITDFVNPSGDTKVRFHYDDGNTWAFYWLVDNVVISSVDCLEPQNATVEVGAIVATIEWDSGSGNSDLIWGPTGFDPNTEGTLVTNAANPYTITGLSPETTYDVYLMDNCGVNGYSAWAGPTTFTTTIGCPAPYIDYNPFSNPTSTSIDVTFTQNVGDVYIIVGPQNFVLGSEGDTLGPITSPYTISNLDPLTFYSMYLFMDCNGDGLGTSLNTPVKSWNTLVDGPGTSCTDPIILNNNLPWNTTDQSICGYGNNITSTVCTNYQGYEEIVYAYAPETDGEIFGIFANNMSSSEYYFNVTAGCPSDPDAVCVYNGSWYSWDGTDNFLANNIALENGVTYYITVSAYLGGGGCTLDLSLFLVTCFTPSNPTYTASATGTEISWTSNSADAAGWQFEWGPEGFTQGTGTIIDGTYGVDGPPITIEGLSDTINYEFYVLDVCGFGDVSIPFGPSIFTGPPPVNDLCENATPISCGDVIAGNISAATGTLTAEMVECSEWDILTGPAVWYSFVGTGDEVVLSTCGIQYYSYIHVYTGDCNETLTCNAYGYGNYVNGAYQCEPGDYQGVYVSVPTEEGVTYYVAVSGQGTYTGPFNLSMECIPCSAPYSLVMNTNSDTQAEFSWTTLNEGATYYYEYGVTGFTLGTGTTGSGVVGTDGPPVLIEGLSASTTYDFYVYEDCGGGDVSESLSITFTTNALPPPSNDLCSNAILLECGDSDTVSTIYATSLGNPAGGLCGNEFNYMEGNTVWWQFVGTGAEVSISTCGSDFYTDLFVMTGSCDAMECVVQSAYNSAPCGDWYSTQVSIMAELGQTYYISVSPDGTWTDGGTAVVSIECIPCSTPTAITASLTDVSATISWTSFNTPADYTLVWDTIPFNYPTDPGNVITGNTGDGFPIIEGLLANGHYKVYVFEYCDTELTNSDTVSYTFTTNALPPPANNDVCNAIALTAGDTLATTNQYGSVQPGEPVPEGGNCNDPDQMMWCIGTLSSTTWYTFTPDMDGMATITTCHIGGYDTQMAMYMVDDCSDFSTFSLVAANDDNNTCQVATGFTSTVQTCLQAGVTYYIQVDPYSGGGASFSISVDFQGAEVAGAVAFPGIHSANVSYNYNSTSGNDVNFTLYYTNMTTNETMTITGNTADLPVLLEGLDSSTMYEYYVVCNDDCNTTSSVESFTTLFDGITELNFGSTVNVYPNPVSDILTIEINADITAGSVISIISMQGQVIYQETVKDNVSEYRTEIDVDNFARGMYLLKLEDENASIQQRIIVQ